MFFNCHNFINTLTLSDRKGTNMNQICIFTLFTLLLISVCSGQEKVSTKVFEEIAMVNGIEFYNSKINQPRFSCGFLLQFNKDTFAMTAKHIMKIINSEEMKSLS